MAKDSGTAGMLATARASGSRKAGKWWHKQWAAQAAAAPIGEAAGRAMCRWRLGSARARLGEAQGTGAGEQSRNAGCAVERPNGKGKCRRSWLGESD